METPGLKTALAHYNKRLDAICAELDAICAELEDRDDKRKKTCDRNVAIHKQGNGRRRRV